MIELDRHIEILLLNNDCVIVPELGGFMAHHVDARYNEQEQLFLPPLRTLGFNPQLKMNDSLLVQSYIEAYEMSYPEALRKIEAEVAELKQHLDTEGQYVFNDLGKLYVNDEGHLEFEPCEAGILTPQLYSLSSYEMPLLQQLKKLDIQEEQAVDTHTADAAEKQSPVNDTITIKMAWIRNLAATAAAVIAFFMITTPIRNSSIEMQQSAFIPIPSAAVQPVSAPSTPAAEEQIPQTDYCIVLASQVSKSNADAFVSQLHAAGYQTARSMEQKNMRRVVFGCYATENDAYTQLRKLRKESPFFAEAWVLKIKN